MHEWIGNFPKVVNFPISSNILSVPDHKLPGGEIRAYKLRLQISIRELNNNLIYQSSIYQLKEAIDEITGKPLISDTALHALTPKDVQKIIYRYKHMCGCKICVIIFSMQASLLCYRLKHLKILIEHVRSKGGRISRPVVYADEKANSYANDLYPNNQHMHLNTRYELLSI